MRAGENSISSEHRPAESFLRRMQFFYELFPYPNRPLFLRPDPNGSIEAHAGYCKILANEGRTLSLTALQDLKLRDVRFAFPNNKKIALVGCGTDEPLLFRVLHPHNPIVGIDLSLKSLQRAERKVRWHQLKPVRLIHGEANHALPEEGDFAHIQCFGVLHHQPQPRAMLSAMALALEHNGTLRLMIYSRTGRRLERGLQKRFASLWNTAQPKNESQDAEEPLAPPSPKKLLWTSIKLLFWRAALPLFSPQTLALRFRYIGLSRARIADAFLHPSDHPLSLSDLLGWAKEEGLELISFQAKSYDLGWLNVLQISPAAVQTLVSEEERGNISSNIVLVFKKVGVGSWISK